MIRVAVINDHAAVHVALVAALDQSRDTTVVGVSCFREEIRPMLYRTRPDVVIISEPCGIVDAVRACQAIKAVPPAPAVLLYADGPSAKLVAAALLADADGVVDQASTGGELVEAVRAVRDGRSVQPAFAVEERRAVGGAVDVDDLAILAMRLAATPPNDIARTLDLDRAALRRRSDVMIATLRGHDAAAAQPALT